MGLMKQVLKNIDLNAVGVTTKKSEFWHVSLFFLVHVYFLKLTTGRVLSKLKIIMVLYFVPNYSEI